MKRRIAALLIVGIPVSCVGGLLACTTLEVGTVGLLATDYSSSSVRIMASNVQGEDCGPMAVPWQTSIGDIGRAVDKAIASVPGANVMVNSRFSWVDRGFFGTCARVVGDVGVLP